MSIEPADRRQRRAARARGGDALVVPRLRDERDRRAGAAGRARRPQARAQARAVRDARGRAPAEPGPPQVRARRRRRDGRLPPARRLGDLRHAGAPRPGLRHALPADRSAQGNFGSIDNDPAAAMRYTEARLARLATEMLRDIDADTVDFTPNYDESRQEPLVLPGALPEPARERRRRDRGRHGHEHPAAQPAASRSTPCIAYIENPDIDVHGLMKHIKGPDFPTGGIIVGYSGIRDAYETGRGRVVVRGARAHRAAAPGQGGDHRHRDALPGVEGRRAQRRQRPDQEDRRAGQQRPAQGDLRPPRRVGQVAASAW